MQPIVKNMALPSIKRIGAKAKYPWAEIQPGEAFKFGPDATMSGATAIAYQAGRTRGMKFAVRQMEDGIYCWRVDGTPYAAANGNYRQPAERMPDYGATAKPAIETEIVGIDDVI